MAKFKVDDKVAITGRVAGIDRYGNGTVRYKVITPQFTLTDVTDTSLIRVDPEALEQLRHVEELDALYLEKCQEVNMLRALLEEAKKI